MSINNQTRYIMRVSKAVPCRACKGLGYYEPFFINQKPAKCYLCNNGFIDAVEETDVTPEVVLALNNYSKTPTP